MKLPDFTLGRVVSDYRGPKLRIAMTGFGAAACNILSIPGASNVLDRILAPYSMDAGRQFLTDRGVAVPDSGAVSLEMVRALHRANKIGGYGYQIVTATAALTTNRYRQGDNHAYIAIGYDDEVWHLVLDKMSEGEHERETDSTLQRKRYVQDKIVCTAMLSLATGVSSELLDEMREGGYILPCDR